MSDTKGSYYIGLDPSMAAFGLAVIDTRNQVIILDQFKSDNHHDFVLMSWAVANLYNNIYEKYLKYFNSEETYIAQEAPISSGINSGKLNALGEHFYINLGGISSYDRIRTYHPMKLKSFHHKKGYNKKDTIEVIQDIINMFECIGYSVKVNVSRTKKTLSITDGEADALMYAIKTYLDLRPESQITKQILEKYPRFEVIKSIEELNHNR